MGCVPFIGSLLSTPLLTIAGPFLYALVSSDGYIRGAGWIVFCES